MNEKIEFLREALYEVIDKGNSDEILKASIELDIEIANVMKDYAKENSNTIEGSKRRWQRLPNPQSLIWRRIRKKESF